MVDLEGLVGQQWRPEAGFAYRALFAYELCIWALNKYFYCRETVPAAAGPKEGTLSTLWVGVPVILGGWLGPVVGQQLGACKDKRLGPHPMPAASVGF